jgi:hypothetical protein
VFVLDGLSMISNEDDDKREMHPSGSPQEKRDSALINGECSAPSKLGHVDASDVV